MPTTKKRQKKVRHLERKKIIKKKGVKILKRGLELIQ